MEEKVVVIIISPIGVIPYVDEMSLWNKFFQQDDDKSYISITANGETAWQNNLCDNYSFVLINQCQEQNEIEKILKSINCSGYSIIAWTHMTRAGNNYEPFVRNRIIEIFNEKLIDCEEFSHVGTPPAIEVIQNFTSNEDWTRKDQRFKEIIIDCIKKKTTSDAHSLRSQILTPFVALHLALQDSFDEKEKSKDNPLIFSEECKEACKMIKDNELKKKLDEFLKNLKGKGENGIGKKYTDLKTKVAALCEVIKVVTDENKNRLKEFKVLFERNGECKHENGLIGDFADAVEAAGEK